MWLNLWSIRVVTSPVKTTIISLFRNFNSDFLTCDCSLYWVPKFFHSSSARLGEETLCAFPRSLRGKQLRGLRENQLGCGKIKRSKEHRSVFYYNDYIYKSSPNCIIAFCYYLKNG